LFYYYIPIIQTGIDIDLNESMKNQRKILFSLLTLLFLLGSCKAYRDVENLKPGVSKKIKAGPFEKSTLNKLVQGDEVIVKTIDGKKYYITFKEIKGNSLNGSVSKIDDKVFTPKENIDIPVSEIENLRVWRKSIAATAPFAVLVAMGIYVGIWILVVSIGGFV